MLCLVESYCSWFVSCLYLYQYRISVYVCGLVLVCMYLGADMHHLMYEDRLPLSGDPDRPTGYYGCLGMVCSHACVSNLVSTMLLYCVVLRGLEMGGKVQPRAVVKLPSTISLAAV
jgi:hypothetical protein